MDSFDLLPSLADGELAESSAPELVAAIFRSRASGTLTIDAPETGEVRQFFRAGQMCGSSFFTGFRTLAQVLLEQEWAQALDVDESFREAQQQGRRHGELLLEKGLLSSEQLAQALQQQHRGNLMALMQLEHGHYEMRGWEPPPAWTRELNIDPLGPMFDAFEDQRLAHRRALVLDWMGSTAVRLTPDWQAMAQKAMINATDHRAISQLTLARSREEFIALSKLAPARAEALLAGLLLIGAAEPKTNTQPISTGPVRTQPPPPRSMPPPPPLDLQHGSAASRPGTHPVRTQPQPRPFSQAPAGFDLEPQAPKFPEANLPHLSRTGELLGEMDESVLPEAVLASNPGGDKSRPGPTTSDGGRMETESASGLELDLRPASERGVVPPVEDAMIMLALNESVRAQGEARPAPPSPPADAAKHKVLSDLEAFAMAHPESGSAQEHPITSPTGDELRKRLRARGMRSLMSTPREEPPAEPSFEVVDAMPSSSGREQVVSVPTEAQNFIDDVRSRVRMLPTQTPWQRLGVSPKASTEQIHAAYLDAVKRYHPDRASGYGLTSGLEELKQLFNAIKEAYDKIGTAASREKTHKTSNPGSTPKKDEATLALKMGEILLKKRDFPGAMTKLRRAAELDPNGDTLAALAWGLLCDPTATPASRSEAEMLIDRSLRVAGATARTHYVAGVSWRARDPAAAEQAFRKAIELDANHRAASQELRLLELRQHRGKK